MSSRAEYNSTERAQEPVSLPAMILGLTLLVPCDN